MRSRDWCRRAALASCAALLLAAWGAGVARAQQEVVRVESDAPSESVRTVGDKTFYMREGVWTDSELKPEAKLPETALEFGSEEYFSLLRREPQLARFFSLGERVVVVYKGRVYRVSSKQ